MAPHPRSTPTDPVAPSLSIGGLSEATGVGVETLRAWERRYGRPNPRRLPSGHRRYDRDDVPALRLVAEAVARGRRPSEVLPLAPPALARLLAGLEPAADAPGPEDLEPLLDLVRRFRGPALRAELLRRARRHGLRAFVERCVGPFGALLGRRWAEGTLSIRHEHFASAAVMEVAAGLRKRQHPGPGAPRLLFATLPGERHGLGCVLAALVASARGACADVLGVDTPLPEIAAAAVESGAIGVGVSVSLATGGVANDRRLSALRALLPPTVALVVGGQGARGPRRGLRGVTTVRDLAALEAWVEGRVVASRKS